MQCPDLFKVQSGKKKFISIYFRLKWKTQKSVSLLCCCVFVYMCFVIFFFVWIFTHLSINKYSFTSWFCVLSFFYIDIVTSREWSVSMHAIDITFAFLFFVYFVMFFELHFQRDYFSDFWFYFRFFFLFNSSYFVHLKMYACTKTSAKKKKEKKK